MSTESTARRTLDLAQQAEVRLADELQFIRGLIQGWPIMPQHRAVRDAGIAARDAGRPFRSHLDRRRRR